MTRFCPTQLGVREDDIHSLAPHDNPASCQRDGKSGKPIAAGGEETERADDKVQLLEIVDCDNLAGLCQNLAILTGMTISFQDLNGTVFFASDSQDVCSLSRDTHSDLAKFRRESGTTHTGALQQGHCLSTGTSKNSRVDVVVPITIDGHHIANISTGRLLLEPPDPAFLEEQADMFGANGVTGRDAMKHTMIPPEEQARTITQLLTRLARIFDQMVQAKAKAEKAEAELQRNKVHIDRMAKQMDKTTYCDSLTGLANRAGFIRKLDSYELRSPHYVAAVIDLARFSDINDGLGHGFGDQILIAVAQRLREGVSPSCILGRISSDIFAIAGSEQDVDPKQLLDLFSEPIHCEEINMPIAVTLGLYRNENTNVSGAIALSNATLALNQAKKDMYTNFEFFRMETAHLTRQRLNILSDLRNAFESRKLEVWYQPQIDLRTNKVSGVEALLRWPDGKGGFVHAPSTFVPLAEHSGLIVDIGYWVIEQCCALLLGLRDITNAPPRFAANVSMVQFRSADFGSRLVSILDRFGVRCGELEVEITENLAMDDPRRVFATLTELKELGVTISVDDFGTGFSSLSLLNRFPIDKLKIDKSFVSEIGNRKGRELAETIVAIGRKLDLVTIAEGIETSEQLSNLRAIGCDVGQGFLLAHPMPPDKLKEWIQRWPDGLHSNEARNESPPLAVQFQSRCQRRRNQRPDRNR